jgi:exodeoxyribonuclease VII large subunit
MDDRLVFGVSDFVAYLNQTLETAYPYVTVQGELSNFRVSKNRWVYFDLKDDGATVRCFGTVHMLPGPLEDGMVVRVAGSPRLHPQYNFSLNVQSIVPVGEGAIRKAADLLALKLEAEGLFDPDRKRILPYPPAKVALITAGSSAAYADFIKIANARWRGLHIDHYDVLVQGEQAPGQIVQAVTAVNGLPEPPDILVLVRGGGSAEDLAAFSTEAVCRAVAGSRVPTLVAIGHEVDVCLAELAADQRASTPSNAAELLTPDRQVVLGALQQVRSDLKATLLQVVGRKQDALNEARNDLTEAWQQAFRQAVRRNQSARQLLSAYNPTAALQRGYAVIRVREKIVRSVKGFVVGDSIMAELSDGSLEASIILIKPTK